MTNDIIADLAETKERLAHYAFSDHRLLADARRPIDDTPLAALLYITASLGRYRSEELVPAGAALELLRLAVAAHYPDPRKGVVDRSSFRLISADYFYARAIMVAGALGNGRVIEHMVRAIADVASANARDSKRDADEGASGGGHVSLFKAAVAIGSLLSDCPAPALAPLNAYAKTLGGSDEAEPDAHTLAGLDAFPLSQKRLLEELVLSPLAKM